MSNNILPWGGLLLVLFCTRKSGWGWGSFLAEADTGSGLKFPRWARGYVAYVIPVGMLIVSPWVTPHHREMGGAGLIRL